jgi:hypothetical protein
MMVMCCVSYQQENEMNESSHWMMAVEYENMSYVIIEFIPAVVAAIVPPTTAVVTTTFENSFCNYENNHLTILLL